MPFFKKNTFILLIFIFNFINLSYASIQNESKELFITPKRTYLSNRSLEKYSRSGGNFGDFFKLRLAEIKIRNMDFKTALKLVSRVENPIFSFWKQVIEAETYVGLKQFSQALVLLRKLPQVPIPSVSMGEEFYQNIYKRALFARLNAKKGLKKNAKREISTLYSLFPLDEDIKNFIENHPEYENLKLSTKEKIWRLNRLYKKFKYKEMVELITPQEVYQAKIPVESKCNSLFNLGSALKSQKSSWDNAIQSYKLALSLKCSKNTTARILFRLSSLLLYTNNKDLGVKYLSQLTKDHADHYLADDSLYKLHYHYVKRKDYAKAQIYSKKLLQKKSGDMYFELLHDWAYPLYKKGKYQKAAKILSKATTAKYIDKESYPKALYWYARSLEKTKRKANINKARSVYKKLANELPYSFYAILAARRIHQKISYPKLTKLKGQSPEDGVEYFGLIDQLNHKGFHSEAASILDLALHHNPSWEKSHKEFVVKTLMESQNYRKALEMASEHFNVGVYGPLKPSSDPLFAAFYPKVYQKQVSKGYQVSTLPKGAIEGIMREESLFQRNARSWVGATGLMQLMPTTAAMVKKRLSDQRIDDDITDARSNILLGSSYLNSMKKYFKDQIPLAIMAYNAGPGNVNKWLRKWKGEELDEFIENVPFTETRGYVKRVMRTMNVYGHRYKDPTFVNGFFSFEITPRKKRK